MPITERPDIRMGMERAHGRFERWRSSHRGRKPIPESLWAVAIAVAREHGIFRTSQVLRLEFNKLKRRVQSAGRRAVRSTPAFVELIAPESADVPECLIELEGPRGKMRGDRKSGRFLATSK